MELTCVDQAIDFTVDILATRISDDCGDDLQAFARLLYNSACRHWAQALDELPRKDAPREVVDHGVQVGLGCFNL